MENKEYSFIIEKDKNNEYKWEGKISGVWNFTLLENSARNGFGVIFYINDSPYPITIYNTSGRWESNFYGEIDIYKIRICPKDNLNNSFLVNIVGQ